MKKEILKPLPRGISPMMYNNLVRVLNFDTGNKGFYFLQTDRQDDIGDGIIDLTLFRQDVMEDRKNIFKLKSESIFLIILLTNFSYQLGYAEGIWKGESDTKTEWYNEGILYEKSRVVHEKLCKIYEGEFIEIGGGFACSSPNMEVIKEIYGTQ